MCSLPLTDLPDGPLALVLAPLASAEIAALAAVCKHWRLDGSRAELWHTLGLARGVQMPRSSRALRSKADLRQTFISACRAQHVGRLAQWDARAMTVIELMRQRDCAAKLRREIDKEPAIPVGHILDPASRRGHATLLHAACRFGRLACAKLLLDRAPKVVTRLDNSRGACGDPGAVLQGTLSLSSCPMAEIKDAGGFTPLLMAAWCGHLELVELLLSLGADATPAGVPPMSSSCGGRGPFDAATWAARKGYDEVVVAIRSAHRMRALFLAIEAGNTALHHMTRRQHMRQHAADSDDDE